MAAIPHGLRLDREIREIEDAIRRATRRDLFEVRIRTAVPPQDIRRAIAEERPSIVHFCGHGLEDGSLFLVVCQGNFARLHLDINAAFLNLQYIFLPCSTPFLTSLSVRGSYLAKLPCWTTSFD
ncbi:hypothetical protein [Nostoc flagelliforme]|uniref:hypothetical protein n=1 Tax=Nostoc flagelliforme TaxID=1306274 RepID=UPI001F5505DE|nr:hypothetical protein [Nostoc flagelliforme]